MVVTGDWMQDELLECEKKQETFIYVYLSYPLEIPVIYVPYGIEYMWRIMSDYNLNINMYTYIGGACSIFY